MMQRQIRLTFRFGIAALAMVTAGCLPSIADLDSGPLNSTFAVSDFFAPSGYMGDGEFFGDLVGTTNEGCKPNASAHRGNCYAFTYYPNNMDLDPWAGVFWVFPANSWGSTPGHAINIGNFKQISFWAAIDGPTPYTVGGNGVPFVGQAGGIDPHGGFADKGELDYVDGVNLASNAWTIADPAGITGEMKQFHIPLTDFNKGAGCLDPMPTNPDGTPKIVKKAPNCTPNAAAVQMGLTPEQAFQMGLEQATFVIGAFAWALHYPIDAPNCADPNVDCHQNQHSSQFVNPAPVHIYLDDIVWDTQDPPATP
jgi:hypothetical protein